MRNKIAGLLIVGAASLCLTGTPAPASAQAGTGPLGAFPGITASTPTPLGGTFGQVNPGAAAALPPAPLGLLPPAVAQGAPNVVVGPLTITLATGTRLIISVTDLDGVFGQAYIPTPDGGFAALPVLGGRVPGTYMWLSVGTGGSPLALGLVLLADRTLIGFWGAGTLVSPSTAPVSWSVFTGADAPEARGSAAPSDLAAAFALPQTGP